MKKLFITILLIANGIISAANYYVDYNATGGNNGTSWQNAWTSLSNISWSILLPGDTVYISQGTYNERIEVLTQGGSAGNPIVISNSTELNHNGEVILNSNGSFSSGIKINSYSNTKAYLTIQGLTIQNFKYGIKIIGEANQLHDITIKNCNFLNFIRAGVYTTGFGNEGNLFNIEVDGCYFNSVDNDTLQTDCIYMQMTDNITISNNYLYLDNSDITGHNDLIQIYIGNNGDIFNNVGIHNDGKIRNCQGFFFELVSGLFNVYNNSIHLSNSQKALDSKLYFKSNSTAHTVILNNTIYGFSGDLISTSDTNALIKNNILYSEGFGSGGSHYLIFFSNGRGSSASVDYNCYYDPTNTMLNISDGNIGAHSIEADPLLVDINPLTLDFDLNSGSPCIDKGSDMSSVFTFDIHNNLRPSGSAWDIGNNEYNGVFPVELVSFSAIEKESEIILIWKTQTEVNNYGFEILRSAQNDSFEKIAFVEGHGNSNSPKYYSYVDKGITYGKYFYRLKQIDNDGTYEYSEVIEVDAELPQSV